jgi:hypothetical protein
MPSTELLLLRQGIAEPRSPQRADRIRALDAADDMLPHAGELMKMIGDVRSELFHYEVRCTYDTPEVAEHRRLVDEARRPDESGWEPTGWTPEDDEEIEW